MATAYTEAEFKTNIENADTYSNNDTNPSMDERLIRALLYLQNLAKANSSSISTLTTNLNNKFSTLTTNLNNEATTRANADTAEATARANADTAEAKARKDADDALEEKKLNRYEKDDASDWDDSPVEDSNKAIRSKSLFDEEKARKDADDALEEKKLNRPKKEFEDEEQTIDVDWLDTLTFGNNTKAITSDSVIKYIRQILQWPKENVDLEGGEYACVSVPFVTDTEVKHFTFTLQKELVELSVTRVGCFGARLTDSAKTKFWYTFYNDKVFIYIQPPYDTKLYVRADGLVELDDETYAKRENDIAITKVDELPPDLILVSLKN